MRKIPQWGSELILKPQEALAGTLVMEPEEAESQMFRIQLLFAYVAAIDPNGRIANNPQRAEDPLIRLMLRLADTSVYTDDADELHWTAFFSVLRDESAEDFARWVTSHRRDFWWRESDMPEIVVWLYEDEDGDVVERFPHLKNAMQELQTSLAASLNSRTPSGGSYSPASTSSAKGGCYIATAVYGSFEAPEVLTLRQFRDERLQPTKAGRAFIRMYYRISPALAKHFAPGSAGHGLARAALGRLVRRLNGS